MAKPGLILLIVAGTTAAGVVAHLTPVVIPAICLGLLIYLLIEAVFE